MYEVKGNVSHRPSVKGECMFIKGHVCASQPHFQGFMGDRHTVAPEPW